jgi:hypothetical protein
MKLCVLCLAGIGNPEQSYAVRTPVRFPDTMHERTVRYHRNTNSIRVVYTFAVHNLSFTICFDYGRDHGLDDEFL